MAIHNVAIQPLRAKECDQSRSVSGHRAIGMCRLGMALLPGCPFIRRFLPKNIACSFVEAEDFPLLNVVVLSRPWVTVKPDLQGRGFALVNRGSDEQSVAPDDWAGVAQTGDRLFPQNVLRLVGVPNRRGGRALSNPLGIGSAKRGPISLRCR